MTETAPHRLDALATAAMELSFTCSLNWYLMDSLVRTHTTVKLLTDPMRETVRQALLESWARNKQDKDKAVLTKDRVIVDDVRGVPLDAYPWIFRYLAARLLQSEGVSILPYDADRLLAQDVGSVVAKPTVIEAPVEAPRVRERVRTPPPPTPAAPVVRTRERTRTPPPPPAPVVRVRERTRSPS